MRVIFMGTPDFAVPVLAEITAAGHEIAAVYTQPPRKAGRGMAERLSPVHKFATDCGLDVRTPASFNDPEAQAHFAALNCDVAVVVAYGLLLPAPVLAAPLHGCLNAHASLLPRWRGAAPIQRAIMAGDTETGICVMQMDEGLDTGPVCLREQVPINTDTTAGALHDMLAKIAASAIVRALAALERDGLTATPQPNDGVTYAAKIAKAEAHIDFSRPAGDVHNHIRGLSPFPGAWFEIGTGKPVRVKVLRSALAEGSGTPATALDDTLTIACGDGAVRLVQVQRAGKGAMSAGEFLRGTPVFPGTKLI
jgi:methionyl-tRNA formyltransferase